MIGTASCGKPDSSTFAAEFVDLRTPSPGVDASGAQALPTPPSSVDKGQPKAPTWSTANAGGGHARGAKPQLPIHTRFDPEEEVDEIISVRSDDEPVKTLKGKEREKPRKRKRSAREKTQPPQKQVTILSESPPDEETLATPPPTPLSTSPARRDKDKGKSVLRPPPRPSEMGSEYEVIQLPSGFDRFLDHGLGRETIPEADGPPPKRHCSSKADAFLDQLLSNRVLRKEQKTPVAPASSSSQYPARVEDMSSENEKPRGCLRANSRHILKSRTPSPSQEACETLPCTTAPIRTEPDENVVEPSPESAKEVLEESPEEQPVKEPEPEEQKEDVVSITAASAKKVEEVQDTTREPATKLISTSEAAAQTAAVEPTDVKLADVKPTLAALAGGGLASLLPAFMALQRDQWDKAQPEQPAAHDCAMKCEVCRVLAAVLHGLHRGGMLGSCCGHVPAH